MKKIALFLIFGLLILQSCQKEEQNIDFSSTINSIEENSINYRVSNDNYRTQMLKIEEGYNQSADILQNNNSFIRYRSYSDCFAR